MALAHQFKYNKVNRRNEMMQFFRKWPRDFSFRHKISWTLNAMHMSSSTHIYKKHFWITENKNDILVQATSISDVLGIKKHCKVAWKICFLATRLNTEIKILQQRKWMALRKRFQRNPYCLPHPSILFTNSLAMTSVTSRLNTRFHMLAMTFREYSTSRFSDIDYSQRRLILCKSITPSISLLPSDVVQ